MELNKEQVKQQILQDGYKSHLQSVLMGMGRSIEDASKSGYKNFENSMYDLEDQIEIAKYYYQEAKAAEKLLKKELPF